MCVLRREREREKHKTGDCASVRKSKRKQKRKGGSLISSYRKCVYCLFRSSQCLSIHPVKNTMSVHGGQKRYVSTLRIQLSARTSGGASHNIPTQRKSQERPPSSGKLVLFYSLHVTCFLLDIIPKVSLSADNVTDNCSLFKCHSHFSLSPAFERFCCCCCCCIEFA